LGEQSEKMIRDPASFQILLDTIARLVREKLISRGWTLLRGIC
jgi:hypothetical protein